MRVNSGAGRGAEPETSRRARLSPSTIAASLSASRPSRWYMVGTPNSIVAPSLQRGRGGRGLEAAEVAQLAAAAQRAEQPEHEPVDVEERQAVGEDVVAGPLPGVGEAVEVGGDRAARQDRALRLAGRPARVDDQRRVLVAARALGQLAAAGVDVDGEPVGPAEDDVGLRVGEHVLELAAPELRVDRHERRAGGERGHGGDAGLERRLRPHRDPLGAVEAARPPRRRPRAARRRSGRGRRPRRPAPRRARAPPSTAPRSRGGRLAHGGRRLSRSMTEPREPIRTEVHRVADPRRPASPPTWPSPARSGACCCSTRAASTRA